MYWFDGQLSPQTHISLEIDHPALLYGASVFTTLRVYGANLDHPKTAWQQHCDRIQHSLAVFQWPAPNWPRIRAGAERLTATYPILRITIFPDGRELITGRPLPAELARRQRQGITAWVASPDLHGRALAAHKTGNYLGCWLALQQAKQQGAQEAILINRQNQWLETSTGNLWGWAHGTWWTPPLPAGILPGVARARILNRLSRRHYPVQESLWNDSLIPQLEVLAYSNAVVECIPIHTVLSGQIRLEYNPRHDALNVLRDL